MEEWVRRLAEALERGGCSGRHTLLIFASAEEIKGTRRGRRASGRFDRRVRQSVSDRIAMSRRRKRKTQSRIPFAAYAALLFNASLCLAPFIGAVVAHMPHILSEAIF